MTLCLFGLFDPSISNVYNLAMSLSQTNFDGKLITYIEFCIRLGIFNIFGWLFFGGRSPKKSKLLLACGTPNAYKEGHSTWPIKVIKKHIVLQFCIWATIAARFVASHVNIGGSPIQEPNQNAVLPVLTPFQSNDLDIAAINVRRDETSRSSSLEAELKHYVSVFENSANWLKYGCVFSDLF